MLASQYRQALVSDLLLGPRTPKEISKHCGLYLSHVSSTLSELEEFGLVVCLTPDLRKGRLYALTRIGKRVAEEIRERAKR